MKLEDSVISKIDGATTYKSIGNEKALTLCDPITQICRRIEAFFKADEEVTCRFVVNNHKGSGPKIDPETGEPLTKKIEIDGVMQDAILDQDHLCEFRLFVNNYEKAQCLSNVIRHRHTIPEIYEAASDGAYHLRNHYLLVRVCVINAVDPDGEGGGENPWITDDDTDKGVQEIYGLEPIDWNDIHAGCNDRLAPSDTVEVDIPVGVPDEYEQIQWEQNPASCSWKWKWLVKALQGNKNIVNTFGLIDMFENTWRFIECNYLPVVFQEDNLMSSRGFNSILPADLLPLIFTLAGKIQVSTYVYKK